ncbi:MAG: hypothetical protein CMJ31_02950 [Phycisphaerae bacterium]|nr:hypothetical protein [Phycisphaerae bacterium]
MNRTRGDKTNQTIVAAASGICLITAVIAGGCVGYGTYPRSNEVLPTTAVNSEAGEEITVAAIEWMLDRDEVVPPVVVSLPEIVKPYRAHRISDKIGRQMILPIEGKPLGGYPIYHIGRLAIRGDEAEIDVYRPVFQTEGADPVYQVITLDMKGGLKPWRVERTRPWALGAFDPPPVYTVVDE